MKTIFLIILFFIFSTFLFSTIINIPADQPTIQAGINASVNADTVLVQPGTYFENINYNGKNITVSSLFLTTQDTTYISQTIIDGDSLDSVITFNHEEDSTAVLTGFTLTNGLASSYGFLANRGGGIFFYHSNPTIKHVIVNNNSAYIGGGIYCNESCPNLDNISIINNISEGSGGMYCIYNSSPTLINTIIANNSATDYSCGGIMCINSSSPTLLNVTISGNFAAGNGGGIKCVHESNPNLTNVIISNNTSYGAGGAIWCEANSNPNLKNVSIVNNTGARGAVCCHSSNPVLTNVTISENSNGSGGAIWCEDNSSPILINSILWNNFPHEIYFEEYDLPNEITISYSDIQGGETGIVTNNNGIVTWLDGNIDSNPLFVDPIAGNYHLTENSPCINTGDPTYPLDPDGTISDMGAFYFHLDSSIINVPGDLPTIQAGINAAVTGGMVLVQPGTYYENINYNGKNITIASLFLTTQDTTYISSTIIDGNQNGSVITFENGEDYTAVLCGFTITNGLGGGEYPDCYAGGITCSNSSNPNLDNLIIMGNSAIHGGGIFCSASSPILMNVTISDNSVENNGGGIFCFSNSNPSFTYVTIKSNSSVDGGGIYCQYNSNPSLMNVTISDNYAANQGGGIICVNSNMNLLNVTISENTANYGGGINIMSGSDLNLLNCILWNDSPQEIYYYTYSDPNSTTISYSDIQGGETGIVTNNNGTVNWLDGNIDSDPLFVDQFAGNYHLTENSPCINAGDPASPLDPDGTIADMGAFYFNLDSNIINVPGDFSTIQAGIDASSTGDTVLVQPGTYYENINYNGKSITVASLFLTTQDTTYISQTIIDGDQNGRVVTFTNYEDTTSVLTGFTITNGSASSGSGINCSSSSPSFQNLLITENHSVSGFGDGGGIYCYNSSAKFENVTISYNTASGTSGYGGGLNINYSDPYFKNVNIINNSAVGIGGGIRFQQSFPVMENVNISNNIAGEHGGGIYCVGSFLNIIDSSISGNSVNSRGGGICTSQDSSLLMNVVISENSAEIGGAIFFGSSNTILQNVTISDNTADYGGGIYCSSANPNLVNCILWNDSPQEIFVSSGTVAATYSDIQGGWAGIGNIDEDPLFVDPLIGDYHLSIDSPCIDTGDPGFPLDPDNTICDMGAFYYHQDQEIIVEEIFPEPDSLTISEGDSINFYITAIDPDGDIIEYNWELDDEVVSIDSCYTFYTDENSAGVYQVTLNITDNYQPPSRDELNFEWEIVVEDVVSVEDLLPKVTTIYQNYPNPFNPVTTIDYSLKEDSKVSLNIYNIKGQKVKQLVCEQLSTGQHSAVWDGRDDNNKSVSTGIYFYKLKTDNYEKTKKMIMLK